jgi:lipoate-protein ligase B
MLSFQHQLRDQRQNGQIPNTILIVEHPPVITLGARQSANRLHASPAQLANRGIDVVQTRRGGGATAHNPGQLVFYPILNIHSLNLSASEYVRELEAVGIELLELYGVRAERRKGFPGLWVNASGSVDMAERKPPDTRYEIRDTKKVASIGVRVSKGITYHGMAINIQNDLSIFDLLVPCGLNGVEMTSVLRETGNRRPMNEVKQQLAQILTRYFSEPVNADDCHA